MKIISLKPLKIASATFLLTGAMLSPVASAVGTNAASSSNSSSSLNQQHLQLMIAKGDQEIERRLTSLNNAASKISGATHLTASDKSYLSSEVSTEISGLTGLKSKLDGETSVSAARPDVQSIFTGYRVYALILPKIYLVRAADDEQTVAGKLTNLAAKLQTRLNQNSSNASLQSTLSDMTSKTNAAQSIASSIEEKVLTLQPSDYNSDHTILSGDRAQLQTARSDLLAAYQDAINIYKSLTST